MRRSYEDTGNLYIKKLYKNEGDWVISRSVKVKAERKSLEWHTRSYKKEKKVSKKFTRRVERQVLKEDTNNEYKLHKKENDW